MLSWRIFASQILNHRDKIKLRFTVLFDFGVTEMSLDL